MTDPRIKRTRDHVLRTAREMLAEPQGAPLTLSALAAVAQVSRRTLYVHWGTIQQVISEAVTFSREDETELVEGLAPRDILRHLLVTVRSSAQDPASNVALATMVAHAAQDPAAAAVVRNTVTESVGRFNALLGPTTLEQYSLLVGPILFAEFVGRESASDELIETLVEQGVVLLGLPVATA
ncbi:TetR family transcriptional regulator [Glaciihabitans tibetensis]|uniref:TetR family transcriptional regulator n=1 Tax=Glaciihabitans tibetensis TaxID=1266600 RepID=A0A2T0VFP0_9MICO|nr:TetR/AcrR family transcriptional regulator [Glaciihabitans tibetensis]PRY69013.1 TetR family transcriptional regulator [Glaciihabitans tibetensis]